MSAGLRFCIRLMRFCSYACSAYWPVAKAGSRLLDLARKARPERFLATAPTGQGQAAIEAFISEQNTNPKPLRWMKSADDVLALLPPHPRRPHSNWIGISNSGH